MATQEVKTRENGRRRVQLRLNSDSKVEQCHKDEVNINSIMARARRTGQLPLPSRSPIFGEFADSIDFHDCRNRIADAYSQFGELPSDLREMFANDPAKMIDFVNNPENAEKAVELGLITKPASDTSEGVQTSPEAPEEAPATPETPVQPSDTSE